MNSDSTEKYCIVNLLSLILMQRNLFNFVTKFDASFRGNMTSVVVTSIQALKITAKFHTKSKDIAFLYIKMFK